MTRERSLAPPKSYRRWSHRPAPGPSYTLLIQSAPSPFHPEPAAGAPCGFRPSGFSGICLSSLLLATAGPKPLLRLAWPQAITDPFPHLLPPTRSPAMTSDVSPPGLGPPVAPPASEFQGLLPRSSRAPAGPPTAFPLLAGPAALASPAGPRALGPPGSFLCSGVNLNASATAHDGFHKYFIK